MIDEKGEKLEFLEKDLFLDREQEDISLWKDESMLLGEPGSDGLLSSSQVYTDTPEEESYDKEDLQLLLRKAGRYVDEGDSETADDLYRLALDMDSSCGEAWLGLLQIRWNELWDEDPDSPFFEDDDAWEYFEEARLYLEDPWKNGQFRVIAEKGFSLGMAMLRRVTENCTDFSDYDLYGPGSDFVERLMLTARDDNRETLEQFLQTYTQNHELYLQLQNLKEAGPVSLVKQDPAYRECRERYEAAERQLAQTGSSSSYIGWGHILVAALVAVFSIVVAGQSSDFAQFGVHLVPFLTAMILVTTVDVIYKISLSDGFWEQTKISFFPALGVYVVLQIVVWFIAKQVDPTVPFSSAFYGVFILLALAVILGIIFFLFVSFWGAIIGGGIAIAILDAIEGWLNLIPFPVDVLYVIFTPVCWLMALLCIGAAVIMYQRKRKSVQSRAARSAAKQHLDQASAELNHCYDEKVKQLRAPYEGHVAEHHLAELVWKE